MNYKKYIFSFLLGSLALPVFVQAAPYAPLIGIPGIDGDINFNDYINALYALSISVGALLAVIKIVIAGMKYMLSDVVTNKSEAISDIQGAIFGLIIVISAVLILQVINPNITEFNTVIETSTPSPKPGTDPAPVEVLSGKGYTYILTDPGDPDFQTDCLAANGTHRLQSDTSGTYNVCYKPLPDTVIASLDSLFGAIEEDGQVIYPGNDRNAILKRWQTAHYPKINTTAIPGVATQEGVDPADVLLLLDHNETLDFIDKANRSEINKTCNDLQRISDGIDVDFEDGWFSETTGYYACILDR